MAVTTDPRKTRIASAATLLGASSIAASVTGTVTETALATVTIPAGAMGLNGGVHIYTTWSHTNSANAKSLRARLGGISGTQYLFASQTTTATLHDMRRIRNRGSASSQVGGMASGLNAFGSASGAVVTSSLDTSASVDLVITGQLANTGETISLESYEVWLVP